MNKNVWPKDESGRRLQQNNRDPQVLNYWTTVQKACELQKGCRYIGYDHINGIAQFNVGEVKQVKKYMNVAEIIWETMNNFLFGSAGF